MTKTRISSKGQVVLPKQIRDALGWEAGLELSVEASGGVVLLRPARLGPPTSVPEVLGCARYRGRRRSLAEMRRAIARGTRRGMRA